MSGTVPAVLQAVNTLYYDPDPAKKKQADHALKEFQRTRDAWQAAHDILGAASAPTEALWFAASTLYAKVSSSYGDLSPADRVPFRDAVLQHLSKHIKGVEIVLTQLSLTIAALAVHMQEWQQPVQQLVGLLDEGRGDTAVALLHILTVLPEECESVERRARQSASGTRASSLCTSVAVQVLPLLADFLRRAPNVKIQRMVLRALLSWVRCSFSAVPESAILSSTILGDTFQAVSVPDLDGVACDVISAFIVFADQYNLPNLNRWLVSAVFQLWPQYAALVGDDNRDTCRNLLQVFMQMAESNIGTVVDELPQGRPILQLVVNCTANPDPELSILTFSFWYILAGNMDALRKGDSQRAARIATSYRAEFLNAIDNIRKIIEYPADQDDVGEPDDESKRFRYAAADALLDISSFFDSSACLEHLVEKMESCMVEYRQNPRRWQPLEACMYSIRSIARNVSMEGPGQSGAPGVLARIMADLLSMTSHPQLRYTATMIIGRYSDWIAANPATIDPLLRFVVEGLSVTGSQAAAAMAFKFVCGSCADHLARHSTAAVMQVYCSMGHLDIDDQSEIIEGVCSVICACPQESIAEYFRQLLNPVLNALSVVAQAGRVSSGSVDLGSLAINLDRLAHLFRSVNPDSCPQLCDIVASMWPLLQELFRQYSSDEKTMEKVCRVLKYCLRATRTECPVLVDLITTVTQLYQSTPWSCFVYIVNIGVEQFDHVQTRQDLFAQAVALIGTKSLSILSSAERITDNPGICEDYFNLLSRCLKSLPSVVTASGLLQPSLRCASLAIRVQHREAARAVFAFLCNFFEIGTKQAEFRSGIASIVEQEGASLFQALISHLLEDLSKNRLLDLARVIRLAISFDRNVAGRFLHHALECLPASVPGRAEFEANLLSAMHPEAQRDAVLRFENEYHASLSLL
ncbi:Importin N-terminal domain-containing protein [Plasmodiophora brassicae]